MLRALSLACCSQPAFSNVGFDFRSSIVSSSDCLCSLCFAFLKPGQHYCKVNVVLLLLASHQTGSKFVALRYLHDFDCGIASDEPETRNILPPGRSNQGCTKYCFSTDITMWACTIITLQDVQSKIWQINTNLSSYNFFVLLKTKGKLIIND